MISIVVAGRNDDYGGDFRRRFLRAARHNSNQLLAAGVDFEYLLAEWNSLPNLPLLAEEFVRNIPNARALVIPPAVHNVYSLNSGMPFHEMAAKNAALRRARGEYVIVTNADILFSNEIVERIAAQGLSRNTLYRAHRIDVDPLLECREMQDRRNQLASGEGLLPPPYYLGAGGDFCLAARSLWHSLRGFNERVRFSTRAKDWQFFLSAAALGVAIEFVGDVYHLDHEGGFRNTNRDELTTATVHFGGMWDIEFGLPVTNPDTWGLAELRETPVESDDRISVLETGDFIIPALQDRLDRMLREWLAQPPSGTDETSAILYHVLCAAHRHKRSLVCRLRNIRSCVALAGLQRVAADFSIRVACNWTWPEMPGLTLRSFTPEPPDSGELDWILEESDDRLDLREHRSGQLLEILPRKRKITHPEYNPFLVRRLFRACLKMQDQGFRKIAVYGAGRHTQDLLGLGLPDEFELVALVTSSGETDKAYGLPVVSLRTVPSLDIDALVLSSASFEPEMKVLAERTVKVPVIPLYSDWPPELWS